MLPATKIVVFTSRLLSDAHRYILRCLTTNRNVLCCTIFTSISEIAHSAYIDSPLGPDAFHEYKSLLLQDYEELIKKYECKDHGSLQPDKPQESEEYKDHQKRSVMDEAGWSHLATREDEIYGPGSPSVGRYLEEANMGHRAQGMVVSVQHFPMILSPLSRNVFVLPSEGAISEACLSNVHDTSISPGLPPVLTSMQSESEDSSPGAILTAHFLYHLAAKMDLKLEIFSLGVLSKSIGKIMMDMSTLYDVGRRNKRSAGLLLIDRTLDLMTPCSHGDSLVDRILSSLPRRERSTPSARSKSPLPKKHAPPDNLQRTPLDVHIPLDNIFNKEPASLLDSMSAFVSGWVSTKSDTGSDKCKKIGSTALGSVSGSLVCTDHYLGAPYLEAILDRNTKDGALLIKKWLQETLRKEEMTMDVKSRLGSVHTSELHAMVKMLSSSETSLMRNKGIFQLASAAVVALSDPHSSRWDAFVSAERMLRLSAGDTSQSLLGQIHDLINKSILMGPYTCKNRGESPQGGLLSFQDALILAAIGYILAGESFPTSGSGGPFSWEEEHALKEAMVDALIENPPVTKFRFLNGIEEELEVNFKKKCKETSSDQLTNEDFDDQWGSWDDEEADFNNTQVYGDAQLKLELRDRVDHLFKFFHKLSCIRRRIPAFREGILSSDSSMLNNTYLNKGFLFKLLTMLLGDYEIPGLEYHSSAVGRFFKSGFGRFGIGQAKPKLADQNVLLVFVVGGINCLEVREAMESVTQSERQDIELILGGTTLLTSLDMFNLMLDSSSFF
ncbi:sec1 family domain-containing protein MIP3 isoform X2 [Aristolochia californica]